MDSPKNSKAAKAQRKEQAAARKKALIDNQIMGTNTSSITSKRSVEHLYYPAAEHFFKYFVPRLQRRSPLVNRGYWFRLKAIDASVAAFLRRDGSGGRPRRKVVVNLGCGSDVLPWQAHAKTPALAASALFIDIDYPAMMLSKRATVLATPALRGLLGPSFSTPDIPPGRTTGVVLQSPAYAQIACDLRELDDVRRLVEQVVGDLEECHVLFVAEVSITYMDNEAADAVVAWAATMPCADFCLLEQLLPNGPAHPFAHNMLAHFTKLQTTLHSVHRYPTTATQEARFRDRAWPAARAWTLWHAWRDPFFMTADDRRAIDPVEPFDEWEEFAVFAAHYVLVHASNAHAVAYAASALSDPHASLPTTPIALTLRPAVGPWIHRHHATAVPLLGAAAAVILGQAVTARSDSVDVYTPPTQPLPNPQWSAPSPRVCAATAQIAAHTTLLVGGRTSPARPLRDVWLLDAETSAWTPAQDLPVPLYRHAVVAVGDGMALVMGGKTGALAADISHDVFLYAHGSWTACAQVNSPPAHFGSVVATTGALSGFIAGGITAEGLVAQHAYRWTLDPTVSPPTVTYEAASCSAALHRFGALVLSAPGDKTIVIGGVAADAVVPSASEILLVDNAHLDSVTVLRDEQIALDKMQRPFWIGAAGVCKDGRVSVIGGGATCYAMGTYWSPGQYDFVVPGTAGGEVDEEDEMRYAASYYVK